jgi:Protein of unknown function (DUF3305)
MDHIISVPLGVVVARERVDSPWQEYAWRPLSVFTAAPPVTRWRKLQEGPGFVHYHIATLDLELHRKETTGYAVNLVNGEPSVYVVLREGAANGGDDAIHAHLVTASPFDVQAYGHNGDEIIGRVAMPETIVDLVRAFISTHHVEDKFVKRQRVPHPQAETHMFGQEPVHVLRDRMQQNEAARAAATSIPEQHKPRR